MTKQEMQDKIDDLEMQLQPPIHKRLHEINTFQCVDNELYLRGKDEWGKDLTDELQETEAFNIEIIYYGSAMEYLTNNDASLQYSLELASDFGFETKNLNSELLASLLASENARQEFYDLQNEIEEFFEE